MASAAITLAQFEKIDELFNACLRRPDIEQVVRSPNASADYIRNVYFAPEWKLFDACVEAIGFDDAQSYESAIDCAAHLVTDCLLGKIDVVDGEAA